MLTSQVIFLKLKSGNPETISGNQIHGLFFKEILGSQDSMLAAYLHNPETPKPFSISYVYQKDHIYWFRIASWMNEISQAVFTYFQTHSVIILNDCVLELLKTSTEKNESDWASRISFGEFITKIKSMNKDTFWVEHFSPTSFKCGDSHLPLPVPELIIKSIYRQFPSEIRHEIPEDYKALNDVIQLKEYEITSVYNRKNYGSIAAFNGITRWQIRKKASRSDKDAIRLLFHFAFYSGIGVKTTQGMGMCRMYC